MPDESKGWFRVERRVFEDEWLFDKPFGRGDAWLWLVATAAHKPTTLRLKHGKVDLEAGQLTASVRFLAERWGWSKSRVERALKAFANRDMIELDSETGQLLITVCNYGKYQTDYDEAETRPGQQARRDRDSTETAPRQSTTTIPLNHLPSEEVVEARRARAPSKSRKEEADKALVFARFWPKAVDTWKSLGAAPGSKADAFAVWMKKLTVDQCLTAEAVLPLVPDRVAEQRRTFPEYNPKNVCRWLWNGKHSLPGPFIDDEDKVEHGTEKSEGGSGDDRGSGDGGADQDQGGVCGSGGGEGGGQFADGAPRCDGPGGPGSDAGVAGVHSVSGGDVHSGRADQGAQREGRAGHVRSDPAAVPDDGPANRRHREGAGPRENEIPADVGRTARPVAGDAAGAVVAIPAPPPIDPGKIHNVVDLGRMKWRTERPKGAPGRTLGQILAAGS